MPIRPPIPDPETLAITALGFLARDPERLSRFLGLTGIDPAQVRQAAAEPHFLAAVLEHLAQDESLLLAFAAESSIRPEAVSAARRTLGGD
jgi:hypothetical protein